MADEIRLIAKGGHNGFNIAGPGSGLAPFNPNNVQEGVRFKVRPKITESRTATYVDASIPDYAGVVVYATSGNTKFSFNVTFVSRTIAEANATYKDVNLLKSWMIPANSDAGKSNPEIIKMYGYKKQFDGIPVVLQNINISYPDEVDYIEGANAWVPIIQTVTFSLLETHTNTEVENFSIQAYKQGIMPGF